MEELYIIFNDRLYNKNENLFCENKDIQSILNYLGKKYSLIAFSRYSKSSNPFKLHKNHNIFIFRLNKILNLIIYLINLKKNKKKVLIISISPYTFILFVIFNLFFDCKFFLYLRSDGYEEYRSILGKRYVWIYHVMFRYIIKFSEVISCHKKLYKKNCYILYPSELNLNWKKNIKKNYYKNNVVNILYVGRLKIEKGIYSLIDIFSKLPTNIKLTIVGSGDSIKLNNGTSNIKIKNFVRNESKLIKLYDDSNIFILPSYTEAYPKVINEALSRMRPVIIFNEIKDVIDNRYGVFSIRRNVNELLKSIDFIKKNNNLIFLRMKKNKLYERLDFLKSLEEIIGHE